jgi:hypothetical protein
VTEAGGRGGCFLQGPERSTSVGPRNDSGSFRARNRNGLSSFVTRDPVESALGDRFGAGSGITGGTPDRLWRRLLPKPKRSGAGHTWSNNRGSG